MRQFLLLLPLLLPGSAHAQEIIGLEMDDGEIYSIDPHSGRATLIASTSIDKHLWLWHALAADASGRFLGGYQDLFGHTGTEIYEIDPRTGQCTFIVKVSLATIVGLAFGPGDILYAVDDPTNGSAGGIFDLHTIDLVTGTTSLIGSTGLGDLGCLTFRQGRLWAWSGSLGLVTIDPVTGLSTDVLPGFDGPSDFNESLCFSDQGVLYQVDFGFWIQDTLTGVPSLVGPLGFPGILGGVEYLAGPTSPFTLGTQGKTGGPMGVQFWGATPHGAVAVLYAFGGGGPSTVPAGQPCAGTLINLNPARQPLAMLRANAAGRGSFGPAYVPPSAAQSVRLQALDLATCGTSNNLAIVY